MKLPIITDNTEVLKSSLCDYNDAYILVIRGITVTVAGATQVALFIKCITKIDGPTTDNAEVLDLVMPMYNLIEFSSSHSETTGNLWFYLKMNQLILMIILKTLMISNLSSISINY